MKFWSALKKEIQEAAQAAVLEAEEIFGRGNGTAKKQAAIAFVVNALRVPPIVREILAFLLSAVIDAAIETAVKAANSNAETVLNNKQT